MITFILHSTYTVHANIPYKYIDIYNYASNYVRQKHTNTQTPNRLDVFNQ